MAKDLGCLNVTRELGNCREPFSFDAKEERPRHRHCWGKPAKVDLISLRLFPVLAKRS